LNKRVVDNIIIISKGCIVDDGWWFKFLNRMELGLNISYMNMLCCLTLGCVQKFELLGV
jgi:hypothetical protein